MSRVRAGTTPLKPVDVVERPDEDLGTEAKDVPIPVPSTTATNRPRVPLELHRILANNVATHPSPSRLDAFAAELGLTDIAQQLIRHAAKSAGVTPEALIALRGQSVQVKKDTRIGFTNEIGDVVWPPNQSEGRGLGLEMTRTVVMRVGEHAIVKVKGSGQAFDHPKQQTQRINGRPRPPIPNPILWDRKFMRPGTTHFGLQDEFAKDEIAHLLVMHALSKRVRGRFASAPVPIEAVRLTHVEMKGEMVSLVRARADQRLWTGHENYFSRDIQDMFERLLERTKEPGLEDLVDGAETQTEFFDALKKHPKREQVKLLESHGIDPSSMDLNTRRTTYAQAILAERFTATHELGQVMLLEQGQYRNNIGRVWYDRGVSQYSDDLKTDVRTQFFAKWGLAYDPTTEPATYAPAVKKNIEKTIKELGQMYGMLRAFGSVMEYGFHPKDGIGTEVTDFVDFEMPMAIRPQEENEPKWGSMKEWPSYNGGIDVTIDALHLIFELPHDDRQTLRDLWRKEAVKIAKKTIALGESGELDDLLGDFGPRWHEWIDAERKAAETSQSGLLAVFV